MFISSLIVLKAPLFFLTISSTLFGVYLAWWYKIRHFRNKGREGNDELVVGLCAEYRPFEFINENGEVTGFDVEFAREIAKHLNKRLHIKNICFDSLILALQQGEVDIVLSGISITPERLQQIDMIPYHGKPLRSFALIFWKKIPENIKSIYDLRDYFHKKVSVQIGTINEEFISKYDFVEIKSSCSITGLLLDIRHGKTIAAVSKSDVAYHLQSEHPKIKILEIPLEERDWVLGDGIGVRKGNKVLYDKVERAVAKLRENGVSSTIHRRWFEEERCCRN